jgi:rubrerythrin
MQEMSKDNLEAAFAGESQAHMKYLIFADRAEKEGFSNVARLFRATAYAEQVHATSHFRTLKHIGKTVDNLEAAIGGET